MTISGVKSIIILGPDNGAGLTQDAKILLSILSSPAYIVEWIKMDNKAVVKSADMFIHLEILYTKHLHKAKHNIYLCNPEWVEPQWKPYFNQVTVFAKTRSTETIFKNLRVPTIFTGFTSGDCFVPKIERVRGYIHIAGLSTDKGTERVIEAFAAREMPEITIYSQKGHRAKSSNVTVIKNPLPVDLFRIAQNENIFHLCPSSYEGWGHYINEAKSVGAVIITTNEAPMNEMVTSEFGYGCGVDNYSKAGLAIKKHVSVKALIEAVQSTMNLDIETIKSLSRKARQSFLENDKSFKANIEITINQIFNDSK